jgi:transketolase
MTVINTCDYNQTKAATLLADHHGPLAFWTSVANFTPADEPFVIGKLCLVKVLM